MNFFLAHHPLASVVDRCCKRTVSFNLVQVLLNDDGQQSVVPLFTICRSIIQRQLYFYRLSFFFSVQLSYLYKFDINYARNQPPGNTICTHSRIRTNPRKFILINKYLTPPSPLTEKINQADVWIAASFISYR